MTRCPPILVFHSLHYLLLRLSFLLRTSLFLFPSIGSPFCSFPFSLLQRSIPLDFAPLLPPGLLLCLTTLFFLLSFYLCIFYPLLYLSLFASAVITTHSFNPLTLHNHEVEVMGKFSIKPSARILKHIVFVSCCFIFHPHPCSGL